MEIVPAGNGWLWLKLGWRLFRKHPAPWIMLILLLLLVSGLVNWVPLVGPFIASLLIPGFSVGLMLACAEAERGQPPEPRVLIAGFRQGGPALLTLGGLYLLSMLLALGVSSFADGGVFLRQMLFGAPPPEAALRDGSYTAALGIASLIALPAFMAFWFAPILLAWHGAGAVQAMFYSFFASLRNWRAFTIYGLGVFAGILLISLAVAVMGMLLGAGLGVMRGLMMGVVLVLLPALSASFYYSYRDIFPQQPPAEESAQAH